MKNEAREELIRQRAYRLWQEDGSPEGRPEDYWLRAELQINAEQEDSRDETRAEETNRRGLAEEE